MDTNAVQYSISKLYKKARDLFGPQQQTPPQQENLMGRESLMPQRERQPGPIGRFTSSFLSAPKAVGTGINQIISSGFNNRQAQSYQDLASTYTTLALQANKRGDKKTAQRYFDLANKQSAQSRLLLNQTQSMLSDENRGKFGSGIAQTGLMAAGTIAAPIAGVGGAAFGGVVGGGLSKLQGGSFAQGAGEGASQGLGYNLLGAAINPMTAKLIKGGASPAARIALSGITGAIVNPAEQEVVQRLQGKTPTWKERAVSMAIGGAAGVGAQSFGEFFKNLKTKHDLGQKDPLTPRIVNDPNKVPLTQQDVLDYVRSGSSPEASNKLAVLKGLSGEPTVFRDFQKRLDSSASKLINNGEIQMTAGNMRHTTYAAARAAGDTGSKFVASPYFVGKKVVDTGNMTFGEIQAFNQRQNGLGALADLDEASKANDTVGMWKAIDEIDNAPKDSPLAAYKATTTMLKKTIPPRPDAFLDPMADIGKQGGQTDDVFTKRYGDIKKLNKISGGGSDRDVYDLGDRVLKVAKTAKGLIQNDAEGDYYANVPEVIERGKDYVVVQKMGKNDAVVGAFLKPLQKFTQSDFDKKTPELQDALQKAGLDDYMNYDLLWNDFTSKRNWGVDANGDPILIDAGTLKGNAAAFGAKIDDFTKKDWQAILRDRAGARSEIRAEANSQSGFIDPLADVGGKDAPPTPRTAVDKIMLALKEAKPIRGQQEKLYSAERAARIAKVAAVGEKVPGEAGYHAQLGQLKGELPKVQFEGVRSQLQQSDIDDLFNQVESSNISPFEKVTAKNGLARLLGKEGGTVPTKGELKLLNEIFPPEFVQTILDKRPMMEKIMDASGNVLNLPRSIMATADLSAPLRQGAFLIGRPKQWVPAFLNMFKYALDEDAYKGLQDDIRSRPSYKAMRESRLAITDMSPVLEGREEAFMSNLAERIPGFGALAKGSNRAYSGFLNKLRADTFDDLYNAARSQGIIDDNPKVVDDIAKFVNSATGRGDLGALNKASVVLNGVFFSPRLIASRMNLLNPTYYMSLEPFVRKEALKSLLTFTGTAASILTLAKLGGADVGTDPRSSDFGKIKVGKTRFDPWGGFQQYFVLLSRLISGQMVSSTTGKEFNLGEGYRPTTRLDIIQRFFESKNSPIASFIIGLLKGQTTVGEKFNPTVEVIDRFIPMFIQDAYELQKEWGPKGLLMAAPALFGTGVQTYGDQVPMVGKTATGKPNIQWRQEPGLGETILNKVTGTEISNIPEDQWGPIQEQRNRDTQEQIEIDKAKASVLSTGVPQQVGDVYVFLKNGVVTTTRTKPKTKIPIPSPVPKTTSSLIPEARAADIENIEATTREADNFPFPDYSSSAPGQVLRADINLRSLNGEQDADIVFHFKSPDGQVISIPQTTEKIGDLTHYGLEMKIPNNVPAGQGEVWATVNGKEVPGTRKKHQVIDADAIDRYSDQGRQQRGNPTLSRETISRADTSIIRSRISAKDPSLTGEELAAYYLRDVPSKGESAYNNRVAEIKAYQRLSDIVNSESITDQQKSEALSIMLGRTGISSDDYQYYEMAKQNNELKSLYANEEITKMLATRARPEAIYEWLIDGTREVNGQKLLTPGVIDSLVNQNIISSSDAKTLKNIKVIGKGKSRKISSVRAKIKTAKPKKLKAIKIPKVKKLKPIKFKPISIRLR